ncbi:ABC-F family ATP-binding cassette domain-containing protein [Clostridium sp. DL1XJH146]
MNLLTLENLSKSYSEKILFDNISLNINEGDKIGLIGINGTGKSTLLKVIAGMEWSDSGNITKKSNLRIEYLSQNPNMHQDATVLEQVYKGDSKLMVLLREYEDLLYKLQRDPSDENLINKLNILTAKMDAENGWAVENEAKTILTKLGITDFTAKISTLSGGQKKRVALASTLISPCDLLILDEPTNHLDTDTIMWLETYLNGKKGSFLMITHDRYFLDRITNKIIELHKGNLYTYMGNYSEFLQKKAERLQIQKDTERKRQNLYRKELAWIRRGAKARSTKQKARIDRFEEIENSKADLSEENVEISTASTRLGKKIIEIDHISKKFDDNLLFNDFSYIMTKKDRIGIVGPNGSGKSTLMNILNEKMKPDSGTIDIGTTVKMGFYTQEVDHMDENLRVIEYIREKAEFITTEDGTQISASQMLENFLFPSTQQWTYVGKLSGGERRRLYLLSILMDAPNVLYLDEPTNDLDIETLTILEDYLDYFNGVIIIVSHDRYFLDRITNRIFAFEGNGIISKHVGNYSDYLTTKQQEKIEIEYAKKAVSTTTENKKSKNDYKNNTKLKFSYKEKLEFEEIDSIIESLENELSQIEEKINAAGSSYGLLQELLAEKEKEETVLEEKMDRWAYLNELAEKIENQ